MFISNPETGQIAPYISPQDLDNPVKLDTIYQSKQIDLYWTVHWLPEFYRKLAYCGFIAVAHQHEEEDCLIPEMQKAYAVLDWSNLHITTKLKKMHRSAFLTKENYRLTFNHDLPLVIKRIGDYHRRQWITSKYKKLFYQLAEDQTENFTLLSVELRKGKGSIIAAELGYLIGSVYTSLTGYFERCQEFNNMGKLQLISLGLFLKEKGCSFWNLGHPYMEYKKKLGAQVLERKDFLKRWIPARDQTLNIDFSDEYSCSGLLGRFLDNG